MFDPSSKVSPHAEASFAQDGPQEKLSSHHKGLPEDAPQNPSPGTPDPPPSDEAPGFFEHLRELRSRAIKALLIVALGFGVAFNFSHEILAFLAHPLLSTLPAGQKLIYTSLPEGFIIHLKIGLWGGVFLSAPFWFYQLWSFVSPGLYQSEKSNLAWLSLAASSLLFIGAAFGYLVVFPLAFTFFLSFSSEIIAPLPALGPYFSLAMGLLLAFGVVFQLPLVLIFLGELGILSAETLSRGRKYAVLAIFVVAAILTPPDVVSQCLMAAALLFLYELSIKLISRREKKCRNK